MRRVLFVFLTAVSATGCATGLGGYGISVPGYEAVSVVAANQAMINALAVQAAAPLYGVGPYGQQAFYGNVPVCRPQDIPAGMPLVSQPMIIVRVDKTKRHQVKDIVGGAAVGAGLGGLSGGWQGAGYGSAAGAGGGLLVSNHEPYDLCLLLPIKTP